MLSDELESRGEVIELVPCLGCKGGRRKEPHGQPDWKNGQQPGEEHGEARLAAGPVHGDGYWRRAPLKVTVEWQRWHWRPYWPRCTSSCA